MKNKTVISILIGLLSILYIGLFVYYIETKEIKTNLEIEDYHQDDMLTIDKVLKFIKDNKIYYLDNINRSFTSDEITNQSKLRYTYLVLKEEVDFNNGVSITRFKSFIKSVFGSNAVIKNENIFNSNKDLLIYYDDINEVYKYNNTSITYDYMYSYYDHVINFKTLGDTYILTVNKFFVRNKKVYASIDNAKVDRDSLFIVQGDDYSSFIKQYILDNYDNVKERLNTYKYEFLKEKGNLILKKYEKVQKNNENM